jgi:hypothetical protein
VNGIQRLMAIPYEDVPVRDDGFTVEDLDEMPGVSTPSSGSPPTGSSTWTSRRSPC